MAATWRYLRSSPSAFCVSFSRGLRLPSWFKTAPSNNVAVAKSLTADKKDSTAEEKAENWSGFGGLIRAGIVPKADAVPKRPKERRVTALGRGTTFGFPVVKKLYRPQHHLRLKHHGKAEETFPATPRELNTSVFDFVQRRDMWMRRKQLDIPFFCTGSYLAVTHSDQWHPQGVGRFVGICICIRYKRMGTTFILRNHIEGHGIEKTFELYSPFIQKIEVLKLERRRRSKLYYLRNMSPKTSAVNVNMTSVPLPPGYKGTCRAEVPKHKN